MRIHPAVLYCWFKKPTWPLREQIRLIHNISALTHSHLRSQMGCGIYAFVLLAILENPCKEAVQSGLLQARQYYVELPGYKEELVQYARLLDQADAEFAATPEDEIQSSGYVVSTLEAAVWCLLTTETYADCVLKAVNLGSDTDTVAAVVGGLAGALYGMEGIPERWVERLLRKELIEELCGQFDRTLAHEAEIPAMQMIDFHCHIVPGVDDGSQSMEMSLEMLRTAQEQGVKAIVCTSHSFANISRYRKNYIQLCQQAQEEGLQVRLYPGTEIDCTMESPQESVEKVNTGLYHPLGNSRYLLLEFSTFHDAAEIIDTVRQILAEARRAGNKADKAVIAHVERYRYLCEDAEALQKLLDMGCLFQINAYSLVKEKKDSIRNAARTLLKNHQVSFLGSDAHRMNHRPPDVLDGMRYVYEICDPEYAQAVCYGNASGLLNG